MSDAAPAPAPATRSTVGLTAGLILLLLAAGGGYYYYIKGVEANVPPLDEVAALQGLSSQLDRQRVMAPGYADADGDLVADPPADPAKCLDPPELKFTAVASDDPEKAAAAYKDLLAHLSRAVGRPVTYAADVPSTEDQVAAVRDGRLHVTAFNTGLVAGAVNTAGFVPLFAPADDAGAFGYEMAVVVPKDGPAKSPADLRGQLVGLTALSSNSGGKAPLVVLHDEFGLRPGRDYRFTFTGDQQRSIEDVVAGRLAAACVASDILAREVAAGRVKADAVRTIYSSKSFPPLCFGVPHNLSPELAAKLKGGFESFRFAGTTVAPLFPGKAKFAPVNYKLDWSFVRHIDDSLSRLVAGR